MQGNTLPRELTLWLQSLNLTYKITNPKRDLSNGWVYAEILSRYYPETIEMYQFDNGFKLDCKTNNWTHLAKFMKLKEIDVTFKDYDPVIHCAPNAAYQLLKKFYTILTGREYVQFFRCLFLISDVGSTTSWSQFRFNFRKTRMNRSLNMRSRLSRGR